MTVENAHRPIPEARADGLVIQELMDEVVIYDLDRHRSHCLNRTATLIWRLCDGRTSVAEMARRLQQESGLSIDEEAVWLGINRLSKVHLLQQKVHYPVTGGGDSRRALLRRLAAVGGLALVNSIAIAAQGSATVPQQCLISCCNCQDDPTPCNCTNNNSCKCCLLPDGTAICNNDCGGAVVPCNDGTCFQSFGNLCP